MLHGITRLVLLIVLKDSKAKTNILGKSDSPADAGLPVYPGFLLAKPNIEMRGYISSDTDADTLCRCVKINISDGNMTSHTRATGSGKGR
ncbi:unnamed protein product [marine sediment metagenome]|uniref:Uncharacterized protein n=1 Tax=marine sediment metagenome TaxID=412755 RepID=X1U3K9_9ZZZZ